jgi:hypothetical protein
VENTLDPVWDNVVEFCTADYTKTVVSLVLHDKDVTTLETLRIKDDPDDFMGSCNFYLSKVSCLGGFDSRYGLMSEKSLSTLCRKSWVFSGCSGFLPQGKLTGWVRINTV